MLSTTLMLVASVNSLNVSVTILNFGCCNTQITLHPEYDLVLYLTYHNRHV